MTDMSDKSETTADSGETAKPRARRAAAKPAGETKAKAASAPKAASTTAKPGSAPAKPPREAAAKRAAKPKAKASPAPKGEADKSGSSGKWIGIGSAAAAIGSAAVAAAMLYSKRSKPEVKKIAPSTKDEEAGGD